MQDINAHKGTVATIAGAIGSGLAQLLQIIPADIGKISVIFGVILTLYYIQVQRKTLAEKKIDLKIKEITLEIKEIALETAEREAAQRRRKEDLEAAQ